jgi:DNA-binding MarR family transcriptional regulator
MGNQFFIQNDRVKIGQEWLFSVHRPYFCCMKLESAILGTITNPYAHALINLELTQSWQSNVQDSFFKSYRLSRQQYNILRILRGQYPKRVRINDIKRRMIDKMSNVSRLVEKMRVKGLVVREEGDEDRRVSYISLTEEGVRVLTELDDTFPKMLTKFDTISPEEAAQLSVLLEKWRG